MNDKLIDIETRIAYQDDSIQQLSDVIYRQQKQIDKIDQLLQLLLGQVQQLAESHSVKVVDEKPPHY